MSKIRVYGKPGCEKCELTLKRVKEAAEALGVAEDAVMNITSEEAHKLAGITKFPTVVLNGKEIVSGIVPTVEEMKAFMEKAQAEGCKCTEEIDVETCACEDDVCVCAEEVCRCEPCECDPCDCDVKDVKTEHHGKKESHKERK